MKIKLNMSKLVAVTLSVGFAILTALNGSAQEQKDPFKKDQAGKTENPAQSQQSQKVSLVSMEMRMIEMPRLAADELFKEQGGLAKTYVINEKTLSAISDMVIKNKAKVVSQSKVVTQNGASCENRSVRAFIYPTEYQVEGVGGTRSDGTNIVTVESGNVMIPTAFETRDVGTMFNVTPTVGPDNNLIDLALTPQRVRLSAYPHKIILNSSAGKTELDQPVFLSDSVATAISIPSGNTVLVSVCDAIADQEKQEKAGDNVILLIMAANIIPVN